MNKTNVRLGIAPINWTNDDLPELGGEIPFEQCISEMALAGYQGCEVGTKYPRDPIILRKYLDLRGLQICNQWFSYELTTRSFEENKMSFNGHLDFLETMGANIIGGGEVGNSCQGKMDIPVLAGKGTLKSNSEWRQFCDQLNELGKIAKDRGFKLAFHHHMGTVIQSMAETDRLLENTHPENVWLNYDCGHFTFAGEDPVSTFQRYVERVAHIHLKDVRPQILKRVETERLSFLNAVKLGVFTVPGDSEGCIDFDALFAAMKKSEYEGWIVVEAEQDPAQANPFEYAVLARNFIRKQLDL
ncbi:MAG: myo-inosose-2 dehydratase [Saprospiraceae bacterium]|nr:myo-inosose-2 dehydratase [Saprospiraceae bacterium]